MSQIVFSGIQPTGSLHIGNYLGAVKNWVDLQHSGMYDCFFCIVDLHALTSNRSAEEIRSQIVETAAELFAAGLDPEKSTVFVQSHVPEHTELGWILNTVTPMAELERMTQYKDKAKVQKKNVNVGLFGYPVLQAADILLYKTTHVPVGEDQVQHVELTRDIAKWFGNKYEKYLVQPKPIVTKTARVKGLLDPTKKMSKSLSAGNTLYLKDDPKTVEKKVKKAVTGEPGKKIPAGVQSLLDILDVVGDVGQAAFFEEAQRDGSIRYGDLKMAVAAAYSSYFHDFRARRDELLADRDTIGSMLALGAERASAVAQQTMGDVRTMVGIR